jgi:hypothetical protein
MTVAPMIENGEIAMVALMRLPPIPPSIAGNAGNLIGTIHRSLVKNQQ